MGNIDQPLPPYPQFVTELVDALQRCSDTYLEEFDEHHSFGHLIAELFATTNPSHFTFTDGQHDNGVDFFVKEGPRYFICQCKCSELDTLRASDSPPTFDGQAIDEILSAIRMLQDQDGMYKTASKIRALRTDYQRDQHDDPEAKLLTGMIAVSGALTPSAKAKFTSEQSSLKKQGISLRLVTWEDIYRRLHFQELDVSTIKIELECDDAKHALLRCKDYCYMLARAHSFYEAFRQHEWNLFDWNVRLQLTNSSINGKIVATLLKEKTRRRFHHYNNGILITCKNYKIDEKNSVVRLNGAQIVNGCQTVRAICEAYEQLGPSDQKKFRETARTQVKIIQNMETDFINDLTITTNDQNPMNQRNLKSNTPEQKGIQNEFRGMRPPWFYERKDGEFKSLLSATISGRWFRKSDYAADKGFRKIGNEELAKHWYSFIGYSDQVVRGGIDFFSDEIYPQIFKRSPNSAFWSSFANHGPFEPSEEHFGDNQPSAYTYLLAFVLAQYIRSRTLSNRQNKESAISRGRLEGAIKTNSPQEIDRFLADDFEYRLNILLSNMKEILLELFALVLSSKYGAIEAPVASKLLSSEELAQYSSSGFVSEKAPGSTQKGSQVIGPTYEFLRYCTKQYFFEYKAEILAASRLKAYLWHRRVVGRMRENVLKLNSTVRAYDADWKLRDKDFLQSLPD